MGVDTYINIDRFSGTSFCRLMCIDLPTSHDPFRGQTLPRNTLHITHLLMHSFRSFCCCLRRLAGLSQCFFTHQQTNTYGILQCLHGIQGLQTQASSARILSFFKGHLEPLLVHFNPAFMTNHLRNTNESLLRQYATQIAKTRHLALAKSDS